MLTEKQIQLVQNTWKLITPVSQEMGEDFYRHLFEQHPELKPLFKSEPKDQAMKLMFMISYLVHRLDSMDELETEISKLAARHKGYGTRNEHYQLVGDSLLYMLKKYLGKHWDAETAKAWGHTYELFSGLMQKG